VQAYQAEQVSEAETIKIKKGWKNERGKCCKRERKKKKIAGKIMQVCFRKTVYGETPACVKLKAVIG
jgi:hypothetical protein